MYENNQEYSILANLESYQIPPRFKHYAIKYQWFRSELKPNDTFIVIVKSGDQLADITTKGSRCILFKTNTFKVLG